MTAAHCTDGADAVAVTFSEFVDPQIFAEPNPEHWGGFSDPDAFGTPVSHPNFDGFAEFPQTYDIGVVTDLEWENDPYDGEFPDVVDTQGYVDDLNERDGRADIEFTVAGYGIQHSQATGVVITEDGPVQTFEDVNDGFRHIGTVSLVNLMSAQTDGYSLHHSGNSGQWSGGTCFGDSGGPVLHGDTVVAITSFGIGNPMCRGNTGFAYRADIETSQDFLGDYLED